MALNSLNLNRYQGLIFDMDGTLVDSEIAVRQAVAPWCDKHHVDLEMVLTTGRGARFKDFIEQFTPHLDSLHEVELLEQAEADLAHTVTAIPGAKSFLSEIKAQQRKWAVATSANRHNAVARLTTAGLPIPEILITADDVGQGKPHPEPFLLAAKRLGVATSKCLAFEDSDQGVRSALSAGCDVIVVNRFCTIHHDHIVARINHYQDIYLSEEVRE